MAHARPLHKPEVSSLINLSAYLGMKNVAHSSRASGSRRRWFGYAGRCDYRPRLIYAGGWMPERETIERSRKDAREGKSPSTQAGEFVREEIEHVREGKHGARSPKQAIAIGLSKARRAGVKLPPKGRASAAVRKKAEHDTEKGENGATKRVSPRRSRAITKALKREGRRAASSGALSRRARSSAKRRTAAQRSAAAKRAARTKGPAERSAAARKAARTRMG
jgi:hypothetical protein